MLAPQIECLSLLRCVEGSIVDASYTRFVARHVVKNGLDHMRLHPKLRQARGHGPTDIVQAPWRERMACSSSPPVETRTSLAPALKRPLPLTKEERAVRPSFQTSDDLERGRRKWDLMRAMILGSLRRDAPTSWRKVDLLPSHAAHLFPT